MTEAAKPIVPVVDVRSPKGPVRREGEALLAWAREQVAIAGQILDNPGGGLLFATQTMGQVRSALREAGPARWSAVIAALAAAEDAAIHRDYDAARTRLAEASKKLG